MVHAKFRFISEATGGKNFSVVSFTANEAISRLFRYEIEIKISRAKSIAIDLDELLNSPARFETEAFGEVFPVHGILASIDELQTAHDFIHYRVVLAPRLWWLSIYKTNEIYTDETTVVDVLRAVLTHPNVGLSEGIDFDLSFINTGQLLNRDYRCQFAESDFDFLSRLMENEGIFYYFDHGDGVDKVVFLNDKNYRQITQPDLVYEVSTQVRQVNDSINAWSCRKQRLPLEVTVRDYNPGQPSLDLNAVHPIDAMGRGTEYLYGEHIERNEEATYLSEIRAEERTCNKTRYYGESSVPRLQAGYLFNMAMHPNDSYNDRDYLVLEVSHEGESLDASLARPGDTRSTANPQYRNSFVAIAATEQFRPARLTPKPRFYGTMTAFVYAEGEADNIAQVDGQGRYRVHMPFDRADPSATGAHRKASAWLRMAQPYVGQGQGMYFPMKNGTEVLLTFINGDPDQPIISGAVPNAGQPSLLSSETNFVRNVTTDTAQVIYGNTHTVSMSSSGAGGGTKSIDDRLEDLEAVMDPGQGEMYINEGQSQANATKSMLPPWEIPATDTEDYNAAYIGNASVIKFKHYDTNLDASVMKKIPPPVDPSDPNPPTPDPAIYDSTIVDQVSTDRSAGDEYVYANRRVFAYPQHERVYFIGTFHEDFHVKDNFLSNDSWTGEIEEFHFPAPGGDGDQFEQDGTTRRSANDINPSGIRGVSEDRRWGDQMNYAWGRSFNWGGGPEMGDGHAGGAYNYGNAYTENLLEVSGYTLAEILSTEKNADPAHGNPDSTGHISNPAIKAKFEEYKKHKDDWDSFTTTPRGTTPLKDCKTLDPNTSSVEKTFGNTYSYQMGYAVDIHEGHSHSKTYGDTWEETYGTTDSTYHGEIHEYTMAGKAEFNLAACSAISLAETFELYGGAKQELTLAGVFEFFFGIKIETYLSAEVSVGTGFKGDFNFAGNIVYTPFELDIKDVIAEKKAVALKAKQVEIQKTEALIRACSAEMKKRGFSISNVDTVEIKA